MSQKPCRSHRRPPAGNPRPRLPRRLRLHEEAKTNMLEMRQPHWHAGNDRSPATGNTAGPMAGADALKAARTFKSHYRQSPSSGGLQYSVMQAMVWGCELAGLVFMNIGLVLWPSVRPPTLLSLVLNDACALAWPSVLTHAEDANEPGCCSLH